MNQGLNNKEIACRIEKGLVNNKDNIYSTSIKKIILSNTITLFNLINIVLFILVLTTKSIQNTLFIFVIIINTIISIVQEIKAKIIIDKLKINTQDKVQVLRNNKKKYINKTEIVLDDILILSPGDTLVVDSIVCESSYCDVDESVITGESELVIKNVGDKIISGTIIMSGTCKAKVISVNEDNYTNKLIKEASKKSNNSSYLQESINKILKLITILITPTAILLFLVQYFFSNQNYNEAILSTVAGIIGMIPEGLVLLTSIALTIGVIKMAKKKVIIQKLNGIETLACIDTLCLDKTGTITDGSICVVDYISIDEDLSNIIANMVNNNLVNKTDIAINNYFNKKYDLKIKKRIPFSSYRKYSLVEFDIGNYAIGAFDYITNENINAYNKYLEKYIKQGYRILTIVKVNKLEKDKILNSQVKGFIILKDNIRKNAKEIIKYFEKQNVEIKIISGDDPNTISKIMSQIKYKKYNKSISGHNLPNDYKELLKIVNDYDIFGRVTPYQKQMIIKALKETKTVGMVGDGVNDILALKEADCGIALANGVQAIRNVSEIVLTESDFGVLPDIVNEGRRVINNIERVASLYLVKTTYSFILSLLSIILMHEYPFYPIQLSLIGAVCVGVPSFFLAFEPNYNKVKKGFLINVFRNALPSGICISLNALFLIIISKLTNQTFDIFRIIMVSVTGFINLRLLYNMSKPLTFVRFILVWSCSIVFYELLLIFPKLLLVTKYKFINLILIFVLCCLSIYIIDYLEKIYDRYIKKKNNYLK